MECAQVQRILLTTSWIDSGSFIILEEDEKSASNVEVGETAYSEDANSELILLTFSWIDYVSLWLMEGGVKAVGNASLGKSADVQEVLGVDHKDYEVEVGTWEYWLVVSTNDIVNKYPSPLLSTDIRTDTGVTVKSIDVPFLVVAVTTPSACLRFPWDLSSIKFTDISMETVF